MKTVDIIERIEGEAKLNLSWQGGKVKDAYIEFLNFRGFEYMLEGKPPLDALIYTPRMCGICGQAHLLATVNALEDLYKNINEPLEVSPKAKMLRELGLIIEIIQSHIKWFYLFMMPDINAAMKNPQEKFEPLKGAQWLKSQKASSEITKALAVFGGQWPHTSYMIPGGIVSDPTQMEMLLVENYIDQTIEFFQNEMVGLSMEQYLNLSSYDNIQSIQNDLGSFISMAMQQKLHQIGHTHNRFFVISDACGFHKGKIKSKNIMKFHFSKIKEYSDYTFDINKNRQDKQTYTWAKSVKYDELFYETGPLARALMQSRKFVKAIYKEHEDSVFTRIIARVDEIAYLLQTAKNMLAQLDLSQPSFIPPKLDLKEIEHASGIGCVEATRGALKHELSVKNGQIESYDVVTPTVWNLGPGKNPNHGVAQKAIIGSKSLKEATIILRSFDVCSVCTTH